MYHNLFPALSLGVLRPFARNFGSRKLDQCPYIVSEVSGKRTAEEWGELMADTADKIDALYRQMEIEKWYAFLKKLKK